MTEVQALATGYSGYWLLETVFFIIAAAFHDERTLLQSRVTFWWERDNWPFAKAAVEQLWRLSAAELRRQVRSMFGYIPGKRLSELDFIAALLAPLLAI